MAPPREHSTLSIKDKLPIIEMLVKSNNYASIESLKLREPNYPQISETEASEWAACVVDRELQNYEVLTDEEIVQVALCEGDERDDDNSVCIVTFKKVGNSEAVEPLRMGCR
ncbi:hypothetical protein HHI36_002571 [Cryptolaemus montrouzieri]|uniref:Uncharacterized protein n=1 Tax=Cryptolaemus montrouzieri TaxID=559131 RepID=A0ABD2PBH3_9CUCU